MGRNGTAGQQPYVEEKGSPSARIAEKFHGASPGEPVGPASWLPVERTDLGEPGDAIKPSDLKPGRSSRAG